MGCGDSGHRLGTQVVHGDSLRILAVCADGVGDPTLGGVVGHELGQHLLGMLPELAVGLSDLDVLARGRLAPGCGGMSHGVLVDLRHVLSRDTHELQGDGQGEMCRRSL